MLPDFDVFFGDLIRLPNQAFPSTYHGPGHVDGFLFPSTADSSHLTQHESWMDPILYAD